MSSWVAGSSTPATESPLVKVSASASTSTSVPSSIGSGPVTRSAAMIRPSVTWCNRSVRRKSGSEVNAPNASAPSSSNAASKAASVGASTVSGPSPPRSSTPASPATSIRPASWLNSGSPATRSASESRPGSVSGGASLVAEGASVTGVESPSVTVVARSVLVVMAGPVEGDRANAPQTRGQPHGAIRIVERLGAHERAVLARERCGDPDDVVVGQLGLDAVLQIVLHDRDEDRGADCKRENEHEPAESQNPAAVSSRGNR